MQAHDITSLDEAALLAVVHAGGNEANEAFAELYSRHRARSVFICARWNATDSEDVAQDGWLALYKQAQAKRITIRSWSGFMSCWFRHAALSSLRTASYRPRGHLSDIDVATLANAWSCDVRDLSEMARRVDEAVECMPEKTREMLREHHVEGASLIEVAARNSTSAQAVADRLCRARRKLRKVINEEASR